MKTTIGLLIVLSLILVGCTSTKNDCDCPEKKVVMYPLYDDSLVEGSDFVWEIVPQKNLDTGEITYRAARISIVQKENEEFFCGKFIIPDKPVRKIRVTDGNGNIKWVEH